ncbi:MAG: hypothetical protein WAQ33_08975 [Gaiellaceae bacterium]
MIGRILAGVLAVALVAFAATVESDTGRLSAERTAAQIVKPYGPDARASCQEKRGYWDYTCRVRRPGPTRTFTVDVRVDDHRIVDRSSP